MYRRESQHSHMSKCNSTVAMGWTHQNYAQVRVGLGHSSAIRHNDCSLIKQAIHINVSLGWGGVTALTDAGRVWTEIFGLVQPLICNMPAVFSEFVLAGLKSISSFSSSPLVVSYSLSPPADPLLYVCMKLAPLGGLKQWHCGKSKWKN